MVWSKIIVKPRKNNHLLQSSLGLLLPWYVREAHPSSTLGHHLVHYRLNQLGVAAFDQFCRVSDSVEVGFFSAACRRSCLIRRKYPTIIQRLIWPLLNYCYWRPFLSKISSSAPPPCSPLAPDLRARLDREFSWDQPCRLCRGLLACREQPGKYPHSFLKD